MDIPGKYTYYKDGGTTGRKEVEYGLEGSEHAAREVSQKILDESFSTWAI